jgi:hypothetical protein
MKTKFLLLSFALAWCGRDGVRAQTWIGPWLIGCPANTADQTIVFPASATATGIQRGFCRIIPAATGPIFVDDETPTGIVDGTNRVFKLAFSPAPALSLKVHLGGLTLRLGKDFTLSGVILTFISGVLPPGAGEEFWVEYRR